MKHPTGFVPPAIWSLLTCLALICGAGQVAQGAASEDPALARLRELQLAIPKVVEQTTPAVVAISDGVGFGSGVIVDSTGLILTAGHVVSTDVETFEVFFPGGQTVRARLLGFNLDVDAAMIQIEEPGPWPFVELGSSQSLRPGDWTICLGHSGGYELGRKPPVRTGRLLEFRDELLVTDAALIGGDSGGPLFDVQGRLVGIHSSIGEVISENRHVSLAVFQRDWDRLKRGDRWGDLPELPGDIDKPAPQSKSGAGASPGRPGSTPQRAKLGVRVSPQETRAVVAEIYPGTPAERIGLKVGDVIETIGGTAVRNGDHLIELIRQRQVGDSVRLQVRRGSSVFQLEVILDSF